MSTVTAADLATRLAEAERRYVERNPESRRLHERARGVMPGGNTRTVIHQPPFPLTIVRGEGARADRRRRARVLDFLGEYTAGLYGHSHPVILEAIREALDDGIVARRAEPVRDGARRGGVRALPVGRARAVLQLGTEANLLALSLARAVTSGPRVLVFEGGYHGGVFFFATAAGSPINPPLPFVVARVQRRRGRDAADRTNTHTSSQPCSSSRSRARRASSPASRDVPRSALRDATREHDVLLVFDEVMTSRLSTGGLQEVLGHRRPISRRSASTSAVGSRSAPSEGAPT